METPSSAIAVHYYVGADGPTVRFVLTSTTQARVLKELFLAMVTADQSVRVALHENPQFFLDGLNGFVWRTVPSARAASFLITQSQVAEWCLDPAGWERGAGLMDGLIEAGSGHQYLTTAGSAGGLVVVGLREEVEHSRGSS